MTVIPQHWHALIWLGVLAGFPEAIAAEGVDPWSHDPDFVDASPGLFFFALFAIIVMLILIGFGVAVGAVVCVIAMALIGMGVVSSSAVYGLIKRSPAAGFRALFLLCGAVCGAAGGVGVAYMFALVASHPVNHATTTLIGGSAGLAVGLIVAALFNLAWAKAVDLWRGRRRRKPLEN